MTGAAVLASDAALAATGAVGADCWLQAPSISAASAVTRQIGVIGFIGVLERNTVKFRRYGVKHLLRLRRGVPCHVKFDVRTANPCRLCVATLIEWTDSESFCGLQAACRNRLLA